MTMLGRTITKLFELMDSATKAIAEAELLKTVTNATAAAQGSANGGSGGGRGTTKTPTISAAGKKAALTATRSAAAANLQKKNRRTGPVEYGEFSSVLTEAKHGHAADPGKGEIMVTDLNGVEIKHCKYNRFGSAGKTYLTHPSFGKRPIGFSCTVSNFSQVSCHVGTKGPNGLLVNPHATVLHCCTHGKGNEIGQTFFHI